MSEPHPSSALIRATIFVRDLDKATAFYRAIGLTETYFEGDLAHPSATAILGFDDPRPFQIRIVKRPGPNFGMVGLFKLADGTTDEAIPPATGPARIGEVALVFYVTDIMGTVAHLRELGATWAPEPQVFAMEHRAQLEVCIRDCDGVFINLVENDPAEQDRTGAELDYAQDNWLVNPPAGAPACQRNVPTALRHSRAGGNPSPELSIATTVRAPTYQAV